MTSESGVLSFLFCWLGPPGVSKAASASYMYGRGDRKGVKKSRRGGNDRREGREGKREVKSTWKEKKGEREET